MPVAKEEQVVRSSHEEEKVFSDSFVALNGTYHGKTPLVYDDPRTGRSFRFVLHRKNVRKADTYVCARCKTRGKYVPIMIHRGVFLRDPASLDHICHLSLSELEVLRLKRRMERLKKKMYAFEAADMNEDDLQAAAESASATKPKNSVTGDESAPVLSPDDPVDQTDAVEEKNPSNDAMQVGWGQDDLPRLRNELQKSEQEPSQMGKTARTRRNEVFLESVKMAVESLPEKNRGKAYVDILHYINTTIFRRYHNSDTMETNK